MARGWTTAASALAHGAVICTVIFWPRAESAQVGMARRDVAVRAPLLPQVRGDAKQVATPAAPPGRRALRWARPSGRAAVEPAPWLGAPIDATAAPAPAPEVVIGALQSADGTEAFDVPPPAPQSFEAARMTPPERLSGPDPVYTPEALAHEIEGMMRVACVVTVRGDVRGCRVLHGLPFMDRAVVDALERRRYSPARLADGQAVETDFLFVVQLRLPR
ncbi:MAG TPA: TonB family protein [Myxococcales bacterium]|nr:TonB family protein [Myxococcales bacterium]